MRPVKFSIILHQYVTLILKSFNHLGLLYIPAYANIHILTQMNDLPIKIAFINIKICLLITCYYNFPVEPTRIILAPSNMDVAVGESIILPCQVQHDPLLDIMFAWYFNGTLTDFKKDGSHFEKVGGVSYVTFLISFVL